MVIGVDGRPVRLALQPVTVAAARASLARLPADERARVARIRRPGRADAVAVSLALTRRVVAAATGLPPAGLALTRTCERCGHPTHGRPRLVPAAVELSVTRSQRWAAVAVAPVAVGVDVEDAGRPLAAGELAPVLSAAERRWLAAGRLAGGPLALWVMKEAVGKAMGTGIVGAEAFTVVAGDADDLRGWRAVVDASGRRWSVTRVEAPGAVLAVAVAGDPRPIHRDAAR